MTSPVEGHTYHHHSSRAAVTDLLGNLMELDNFLPEKKPRMKNFAASDGSHPLPTYLSSQVRNFLSPSLDCRCRHSRWGLQQQ